MQESFEVTGGVSLKGTLTPQGAKNEALQVLCAVLLTKEKVTITNVPNILDVRKLLDLLKGLGVKIRKIKANAFTFQADEIDLDFYHSPAFQNDAKRIRGSVMLIAPLLARFGRASLPKPGGDKIGRRRLDTHLLGFQKLGAKFKYEGEKFFLEAKKLKGTYLLMDEISVTGTANVVMAASLAKGTTTIYNAACEPYLQQLCRMLNDMGAKISGIGSNLLTVEGVEELGGTKHRILPDMIEIGSFIGLAAMTQSEITIKDCRVDQLGNTLSVFRKLGVKFKVKGDDIFVPKQKSYTKFKVLSMVPS